MNPPGTVGTGYRLLPNAGRFDDLNSLIPIGQAVSQAGALKTFTRQVIRQAASADALAHHDAALDQVRVPEKAGCRG